VEKYLAFKTPPHRRHFTKKLSALAPYEDYILKRWEQGCCSATLVRGVRRDAQRQGAEEQRVGSLAVEGVDGEGQNIRDHRIEDFRREAAPGH
jgi:hypothetical protein